MKRFLRWLIPVAIIAIILYFLVVWFTGQQTRSAANEYLESFQQANPQVQIELEWVREGFWRSEAIFRVGMEMPLEDEVLVWRVEQPMNIHHSVLRSFVSGELHFFFNEQNLTREIFADSTIEVDGTLGQGGISFNYYFPELNYIFEELRMHTSPAQVEFVYTGEEQHSRMQLPVFNIQPVDSEDGVFMRDLMVASQTRLRDGEPQEGVTEITLGEVRITEHGQTLHSMEGVLSETSFNREQDELSVRQHYAADQMTVGGLPVTANIELHLSGLPYAALRDFSQSVQNEEDLEAMFSAVLESGAVLSVETIDIDMSDWGQLQGSGEFSLQPGATLATADLLTLISGHVVLTELPLMVQLSFAELGADQLPLRIEITDGAVLLNGNPLPL